MAFFFKLLQLINEFLSHKLSDYQCFLDSNNSKHRYSNVFLQLINYSNNFSQDTESWIYRIKFPIDPDRQLEVQGAILALSELFKMEKGASSEIDFEKTWIELSITKSLEYENIVKLDEFLEQVEPVEGKVCSTDTLDEMSLFTLESGQNNDLIILFQGINLVPPLVRYTEKLEFLPKLEWKRLEEGTLYLDEAQEFKMRLTIKGIGTAPDLRKIPPNSTLKVKSSINLIFSSIRSKNPVIMEMITSNYCVTTDGGEHNWIWQLEQM